MNTTKYDVLTSHGYKATNSMDLKVGQVIKVHQN